MPTPLDFRVQSGPGSLTEFAPGTYFICDPVSVFGIIDPAGDDRIVSAILHHAQGEHEGIAFTTEGLATFVWAEKQAKTHNVRQLIMSGGVRHLGTISTDSGLLAMVPARLARPRLQNAAPRFIDSVKVDLNGFEGAWRLGFTCIGGDLHVGGLLGIDVITSGTPSGE